MVSSLAQQLAADASANAALLVSRSKKSSSSTESYLFTSREASQHDLDSILALAQNGIAQLALLNPALSKRPRDLFSDSSREYDRTLVPKEEIIELDAEIGTVLRLVSPYLLQPPAAKIIEWLVRKYRYVFAYVNLRNDILIAFFCRVQEFNQDDVLACFLPYHESPAFAKIVSIIHLQSVSLILLLPTPF